MSLDTLSVAMETLVVKHWVFLIRLQESEEGGPRRSSPVEIVPRVRMADIFQGWGSYCEGGGTLPKSSKIPKELGKGKGLVLFRDDSAHSCLIWVMPGPPP